MPSYFEQQSSVKRMILLPLLAQAAGFPLADKMNRLSSFCISLLG
jgi:hypothetical protein